ncbi:MAG TPA: AbrB/MazE/SpoVT family DNA-binding domain-containing protein [Acidimicrobiales bacterium]|nr:AbrB/MazE/SpoVT family DNA-binding domain-containing protein [Acidimicrobiales bacterium]
MPDISTARVSQRGQTNVPAPLRHRWGLVEGGEVSFIDLGDSALILPGGEATARAEILRVYRAGAYEEGIAKLTDPDLAD